MLGYSNVTTHERFAPGKGGPVRMRRHLRGGAHKGMTRLPRRTTVRSRTLSTLLAVACTMLGAASATSAAMDARGAHATARSSKVVKRPVTFQVRNVNR